MERNVIHEILSALALGAFLAAIGLLGSAYIDAHQRPHHHAFLSPLAAAHGATLTSRQLP